jgi:acyl-CoA thioesterase-2
VTAHQEGETVFVMSASFHTPEPGDDWHLPAPAGMPDPESLPPSPRVVGRFPSLGVFDVRPLSGPDAHGIPMIHPYWVRVRGVVPDDPILHACLLTFMSDLGMVRSARAPGSTAVAFAGASLDHAVWFHRPVRVDDWLLYSVDPVSNSGARGLARGALYTRDGVLVASVVQEALLRSAGGRGLP